jgi:hypothetical protein
MPPPPSSTFISLIIDFRRVGDGDDDQISIAFKYVSVRTNEQTYRETCRVEDKICRSTGGSSTTSRRVLGTLCNNPTALRSMLIAIERAAAQGPSTRNFDTGSDKLDFRLEINQHQLTAGVVLIDCLSVMAKLVQYGIAGPELHERH